MSLGGEDSSNSANSSDDALGEMIDEAYSDGILTVCAAGNSTSEQSVPYADYPGDRDTCLSVMNLAESIGWSTTNDAVSLSSSSNYNVSGSTAKDICAPGSDIYSTLSNGSYGEMSGTSMASPLVAGIAALVFAKDESLTPQEVMDLLEGTATDLGTSGWDETYGYGEVNAAAAVEDVSATISGSRSVKVGNTAQYTVASGLENSSELSWTWTTSDSSIATISSSGLLDAQSSGVVTINVTCTTDSSIKASFTVIVTGTTLAGDDEVCVGDQASYTASPTTLSWTYTSSDTNIATVASASGLLTAKNIGTVTITATCNSDSSIKITKQVSVSAKSIDTAKVSVADQTYTGSALTPTVTVSLEGKTLTQDVDYSVSYSNNTDIGTATVTIIGKSNYSGTIQASFSIKASSISMYRLYNPNSGEHFYTSSASEKTTLVSAGWHYEGIGWTAPSVSSTPVYRLYNPNAGDHFYTSDASERDHLVSVGWNYEGIGLMWPNCLDTI
jgi:uncharacterized protein YjdB